MKLADKIIDPQHLREQVKKWRKEHTNIVFCHGHFNVIHPGHLRFLEHAKEQSDLLLVGVMADRHFTTRFSQGFFHQNERVQSVAALHMVDQVILLDQISIADFITAVRPEVYIMGKEFEEERLQEVQPFIDLVREYEGKVLFHSGDVHYASTDFLSKDLNSVQNTKMSQFRGVCQRHNIQPQILMDHLKQFNQLNLLVIGDTIVDQYIACDPIGMSAEAPVLVLRELETKEFIGGGAIVACHVHALGAKCHYLSVIGNDAPGEFVERNLLENGVKPHLFTDPERPTTFKIRYMVENQKLLRVSRLQENSVSRELENQLIAKVEELAPSLGGIIVSDFVYGVITKRVLEAITRIAHAQKIRLFGDLQCSSQIGNVTKFQNFDCIFPTEREARIAMADQESGLEKLALEMLEQTKAKNLLITLGAEGFIAYQNGVDVKPSQHFPALAANPVDVAGAGDSVLASMSASICAGATLMEASAIGTCVASIAVSRVGNIPVKAEELENYLKKINMQGSANIW